MIWIIGIAIGVVVLGIITIGVKQEKTEFSEQAKIRAEAYMNYIRRTPKEADFNRMSDLEIRDLIVQKIRYYKRQCDTVSTISRVILVAGIMAGIIAGDSASSWRPFFVWSVLAFWAKVSLADYLTKRLEAKLAKAGFDPERLKVEI